MKTQIRLLLNLMFLGTAQIAVAQTHEVITLIAPGGARAAIEQLIPAFEQETGFRVKATFGSGLGTKQQIARGDAGRGDVYDVAVIQPPYPEVLASGHVMQDTARNLASVAVGLAVRKGAARPSIGTAEALRTTLLVAKSLTWPDPAAGAAAGVSFEDTLRRLGIGDQVASKSRRAQGGAGAMSMVAKGEAEIGLTFLSEMNEPGIDIAGPLPAGVSTPTLLVAFVSAHAKNPQAALALIDYLSSTKAAPVYRAHGMQPGR